MWLFTRYGFYSIAGARQQDDPAVMVGARRKADLAQLQERFPALAGADIITVPDDYPYRLIVPSATWVTVIGELAQEEEWPNFKNEAACFQGDVDADYAQALDRVRDVVCRLQGSEHRGAVKRSPGGVITNAEELPAHDLAKQRVVCPACKRKVFLSWPQGWKSHAGHTCTIAGATPEEREANFMRQYDRLFP